MRELELVKQFEKECSLDLMKINELSMRFNYFVIIKKEISENIHSDVLAWLFNPKENHNLQGAFLSQFAIRIGLNLKSNQLNDTIVNREKFFTDNNKRIDILITDNNSYFIAIENKIKTKQEKDQLIDYYQSLDRRYGFIKNQYYVFLTPEGDDPNHEKWEIFDYHQIYEILSAVIEQLNPKLDNNVKDFLDQYKTVIRRYVLMSKDEIKEICKKLYKEHKEALDIIYEHRMDKSQIINDLLLDIINDRKFLLDDYGKTKIKFTSQKLDSLLKDEDSKNSSNIDRPIMFEFQNNYENKKKVDVRLLIKLESNGEKTEYRKNLFKLIKTDKKLFPEAYKNESGNCNTLWKMNFLSKTEYENLKIDEIKNLIADKMITFETRLTFFVDFFENNLI